MSLRTCRGDSGGTIGKTKRIRQILMHAEDQDPTAGLRLCEHLVALLRADGMFTPNLDTYAGTDKVSRLQAALSRAGYTLTTDGVLHQTVIDNLSGTELSAVLKAYINRVNLNPDDAPLQIGTGKELDEAAARHVLIEKQGSYAVSGRDSSFPVTLAAAFTALGLEIAPDLSTHLHSNPHKHLQQCLFMLGLAVNRLRNDAGTGHGRPDEPHRSGSLTPAEGRLVARTTALLAGMLLDS